ncbi:Ltp family lipoprotein [Blastococcus sp. SYSU D01042]
MQPYENGSWDQQEQALAPSPLPSRGRRRGLASWGLAAAALLVGASIGFLAGHTEPEGTAEYQALEERLADREADVVAAEREARDAAREAERDADESMRATEEEMESRAAELDQREADLVAREEALAAPAPAPTPTRTPVPSRTPAPNAAPVPAPAPQAQPEVNPGLANARGEAQAYLRYSSFSRQGLIEQLQYEGFTPEQAQHGAAAVGY